MRRASPLLVFGLSAFAWMVVLTLAWTQVSAWTSYPVTKLTQFALEEGAPGWVRTTRAAPGLLEVDSAVVMPVASAGGRLAEATVESDPGRYAYGLPVFLALLLAARGKRRIARGVAGYVLLLPLQTFSAVMFLLMQIALYAQMRAQALGVAGWQVEAVVYGYQLGSLVVPTLAPIMLWLWLDRRFVAAVIAPVWSGTHAVPAPALAPPGSATHPSSAELELPAVNPLGACALPAAPVLPEAAARASGPLLRHGDSTRSPAAGEISSSSSVELPQRR